MRKDETYELLKASILQITESKRLEREGRIVKEPIFPVSLDHVEQRLLNEISGCGLPSERVSEVIDRLRLWNAGLLSDRAPIGTFMITGLSGAGKTHFVESVARALHGSNGKVLRIDCGEYQLEHMVSKLVGAPPSYLGHKETSALFNQSRVNQHASEAYPITVILFDEIEKAAFTLFDILLGIMDSGKLSLGDNSTTDFSRTMIFFTSNLGTKSAAKPGFIDKPVTGEGKYTLAVKEFFRPEFINRLTGVIPYPQITRDGALTILEKFENEAVDRLARAPNRRTFPEVTEEDYRKVLDEGYSTKYGVRELRRAWEKLILLPFAKGLRQETVGPVTRRKLKVVQP